MLETLCDAAETGPSLFAKHRPMMLSRIPVHLGDAAEVPGRGFRYIGGQRA
jgi:hypothetical protein